MIDKKHLGNLYVPKDKVQDLLNWRANVEKHIYDPAIGEEVVREDRFIETKTKRFTYYGLYTMQNYHWHPNGEKRSNLCGLRFLKCVDGCLVISSITSWGCNYLYDLIVKGIVKQFDRDYTYIDYAKTLEDFGISITDNELDIDLRQNLRDWVLKNACPLEYKALKEIIALYKDWLGNNKLSDFEFFTLLNEIVCKYGLKEAITNE